MSAKNQTTTLDPLPDIDLAELVKTVRAFAGLTQRELAEKLSCSRRNVEDWERGVAAPSGQYLAKLFLLREQLLEKLNIPLAKNNPQDINQQIN